LLTGSLALILADRIPWSTVYLLSGVMVIGLIATITAPETGVQHTSDAVLLPW